LRYTECIERMMGLGLKVGRIGEVSSLRNCPPESGGQCHSAASAMTRGVVPKRYVSAWEPPPAASDKTFDAAALLTQEGSSLCAEHVRQFGGESPLPNLMEVKG
jgi:hypothetical protein